MSISRIRSWLYGSAKILGDVQAVKKVAATHSLVPVEKRIARRLVGKLTGRFIGRIFR